MLRRHIQSNVSDSIHNSSERGDSFRDLPGCLIISANPPDRHSSASIRSRHLMRSPTCPAPYRPLASAGVAKRPCLTSDTILQNRHVVTVDPHFSILQALAVSADRIIHVGRMLIMPLAGPDTRRDRPRRQDRPARPDRLARRTRPARHDRVRPSRPRDGDDRGRAGLHRRRAEALDDGQWIVVRQVFITRLRSSVTRPGRTGRAAPRNPSLLDRPRRLVNTLALKLSGIDKDFSPDGARPSREGPADRRADRHPRRAPGT